MLLATALVRDGRAAQPVLSKVVAASTGSSSTQRLASVTRNARGYRAYRPSARHAEHMPRNTCARQQQRGYRLLPSQTLSLVEAHMPAAFGGEASASADTRMHLASTVEEVQDAVESIGAFPSELQADVLDLLPSEGLFTVKVLESDTDGTARIALRGARQTVWNKDEAVTLARLWLDKGTSFASQAQPLMQKTIPRVIIRKAPRTAEQIMAKSIRLIVTADRKAHPAGDGFFFGPTLSVVAGPSAFSTGAAQHLNPNACFTVGIDVSSLRAAKSIGETSSLSDDSVHGEQNEADEELVKVAQATSEHAWQQQKTHLQLEDSYKQTFCDIAKQAITAFWHGDGDRFVLDVMLSGSDKILAVELLAAEMQFDDDSLARQKTLSAMRQDGARIWGHATTPQAQAVNATKHELHELEELAEKSGMVYRKHRNGNVGLFGYGAGMGMGTVDGLIEEGGRPANFFDGGGGASIANSKEAMRILSKDPDVKCILVNIFGGITRSDLVSKGIIEAYHEYDIKVPLVCRFRGNKAQEAQATLRDSDLNAELFDDYRPAAKRATEIAEAASAATSTSSSSISGKRSSATRGSASSQQKRGYATTAHAQGGNVQAVVGYAFAGKPRQGEASEPEPQQSGNMSDMPDAPQPRQGFPAASQIGAWVDAMLQNGEAGEDALLVSSMKGKGDWILAVADGVGGWSENGIDPALFSQALMYHAGDYARQFYACPQRLEDVDTEQSPPVSPLSTPPPSPKTKSAGANVPAAEAGTPVDILQYAYQQTLAQKEVPAGSATACIVTFDSSKGVLRSANLGDSGFLVLRSGTKGGRKGSKTSSPANTEEEAAASDASETEGMHIVHYQSKPQTHGFNTPLQLSKLPPEYRFDNSIESQPHHAATYEAHVRDGDMVMLATDGFWDNVSTAEVLQLVAFVRDKHRSAWLQQQQRENNSSSQDSLAEEQDFANVLAHNLLTYARMCQNSTTKTSPFERDAARHGIHYPGGKVDDVALLVSIIVER